MKYVIEINDHPMNDPFTPALYRAKGFKTLVFDEEGLSKLTPLNEEVYSTKNAVWNNGFVAGKQEGKKEANQDYGKGYDKGYDKGYETGFEEGKEAMKEIVINNLRKILERG